MLYVVLAVALIAGDDWKHVPEHGGGGAHTPEPFTFGLTGVALLALGIYALRKQK